MDTFVCAITSIAYIQFVVNCRAQQTFFSVMVKLHEFLVPELNALAKAEGFTDGFTLNTSLAANVGDGFMGLLLRVVVEGTQEINRQLVENSKLSLIVKMPPDSPERREQFKSIPIFEREAVFYEKWYPRFVQFQQERGITEESDGFYAAPKCYKVISDPENQQYAMIIEDLKVSGYQMFDKHKVIDADHVTLLMKQLARLHALSFAIRDQKPEWFAELRTLEDMMSSQLVNKQFEMMMQMGIDRAIKSLKPNEVEIIKKMEKLKEEIIDIFYFCASHKEIGDLGVMLHGDCWNNNMMYAYDKDGTLNSIRLVDFQLIRYAAPINDLVYFLFTSTTKELRDEHYDNLLETYYQTLSDFLTRLGSDSEKLYTHEDFKGHLKKFGRFGLATAVMLVQMIVLDSQDIPDMDEMAKNMANNKDEAFDMSQLMQNESSDKAFNKRISDVVRDIVRLGYY